MMSEDEGLRALGVLASALHSTSRVTRLRAVSMLARVECRDRIGWLEAARADTDRDVAAAAGAVLSWVIEVTEPPWPQREDPRFDRLPDAMAELTPWAPEVALGWQWEYVVEVWRDDGLLVGAYLATTCEEDDEHARRIALGQAILANAGGKGDRFDAATAAAFIVGKRSLSGRPGARSRTGPDSGSRPAV